MVGLVIVSHSHALVTGLQELVAQMVPDLDNIAFIGGTGDAENPIGTDPMQVMEAITQVATGDGVLILMDLGSALLSAETALDFVPDDIRQQVRLSSAPIVEGTLSAAVQASLGADLKTVAAEAGSALHVKAAQLGDEVEAAAESAVNTEDGIDLTCEIKNVNGLHARPAARLVSSAGRFSADITLVKGETRVNAKSINQVATLGVRCGDKVVFNFSGADAEDARQAMTQLYQDNFGEDLNHVSSSRDNGEHSSSADGFSGRVVCPGIAIGPAWLYHSSAAVVEPNAITDVEAEIQRFQQSLTAAVKAAESLQQTAKKTVGEEQAEIFAFHKLLLEDEQTINATINQMKDEHVCAEYAWSVAIKAVATSYEALNDEYLRGRVSDVYDVQNAVLQQLGVITRPDFTSDQAVVVIAQDLSPSVVAELPRDKVLGICLAEGGVTSHAAIIAASRGIPTLVGVRDALTVRNDDYVIIDGGTGRLLCDPDVATLKTYQEQQELWQQRQDEQLKSSQQAAVTTDGVKISVMANIGGSQDLQAVINHGADGVGLFRTEFLFLDRNDEPDEEEQYQIYRTVAEGMVDKPVIIRTLDIGGDKPVPYIFAEEEENPFLGLRGIRLLLANKELFMCQLRAILRSSYHTQVKIMFPMVSTVSEFHQAAEVVDEAKQQLREAGQSFNEEIALGVMIEVPAAVACADQLAEAADFFSIGTNDLTQYVMAADRGNPRVADLPDPYAPAVLRMIKQTVSAGQKAGIEVGMCGAFAGFSDAAALLVGLGLTKLSMSAAQIPAQKEALRQVNEGKACDLAVQTLNMKNAAQVKSILADEG